MVAGTAMIPLTLLGTRSFLGINAGTTTLVLAGKLRSFDRQEIVDKAAGCFAEILPLRLPSPPAPTAYLRPSSRRVCLTSSRGALSTTNARCALRGTIAANRGLSGTQTAVEDREWHERLAILPGFMAVEARRGGEE